MKLALVVLTLAVASCAGRALDAGAVDGRSMEPPPADLRSIDLLSIDLQSMAPPADASAEPPDGGNDLAIAPAIGVPCNGTLCGQGFSCCLVPTAPPGLLGCGTELSCNAEGYHCDGPEDCAAGQVCIAHDLANPPAREYSACGEITLVPPGDPTTAVACHSDADCPTGDQCHFIGATAGGPALSVCR